MPVPDPAGTDYDDYPDVFDCELCAPINGSEPYPYAHCCGCGADGSSQYTDCTCA
ncbi:hypothetical protein ACWCZ5_16310 [Streptomyces sp. NPDC001667]